MPHRRCAPASDAARVAGLHLQFGADAATEMVVSWHAPGPVGAPRVMYGTLTDGLRDMVTAETVSYSDALSGNGSTSTTLD